MQPVLELLAPYFNWAHKALKKVNERKEEISNRRMFLNKIQGIAGTEAPRNLNMNVTPEIQQPLAAPQFVRQLVKQYARRLPGDTLIGYIGETKLQWFVDLRDAVLQKSTRELLSTVLANHIRGLSHIEELVAYNRVAVPEPGNQLLGVAVAEQLGVPAVVVKSATRRINSYDTFDGSVRPGDTVIVVDDVITSGAMLRESIEILRNIGVTVAAVFAVISRRDPKEWPDLVTLKPPVRVFPILRLSDEAIAEIVADH